MTEHHQNAKKIFETRRAPGFLFNALSKAYDAHTNRVLKPLQLKATQWPILDQIYLHEGVTQRELAALCLRDPSTLVSTIDALEKRGYIQRQPDTNDRRVFRLYITKEGVRVRHSAFAATSALFEKVTDSLTQEDIDHLYNTCITIYLALQNTDN